MTTYNTGNPVPSTAVKDLYDNAQTLDEIINSGADTVKGRFGQNLYTWGFFHRLVETAKVQIDGIVTQVVNYAASGRQQIDQSVGGVTNYAAAGRQSIDQSVASVSSAETSAKAAMAGAVNDLAEDLGNKTFATYSEMTANRPKYNGTLGWVQSDVTQSRNGFYQWDAATSKWLRAADQLVTDSTMSRFIGGTTPSGDYLQITDEEGSLQLRAGPTGIHTRELDIMQSQDGTVSIADAEGGLALQISEVGARLGGFEVQYTDSPGMLVADQEGGILNYLSTPGAVQAESTLRSGIMFHNKLAVGPAGLSLYVASIIKDRDQSEDIVASVSSDTTAESSTGQRLQISNNFGSSGTLNLRSAANPAYHLVSKFTVAKVSRYATAKTINILFIGDSIGNREGLKALGAYLAELNVTANFIGTINSSGISGSGNDATGPLGEAREGWESGDFTYAVTDRVQIVSAGGEATYQALSKSAKWPINPFLRAATGSDSAAVVRNGYVFDPAFYQARFGLATPDIVINALGTNDVRDRSQATIYADVLDGENIIHSQVLAAWPAAKIIRTFPATGSDVTRDAVWRSHYTQVLAAIKAAAANKSAVKICPLWAVSDIESGYAAPATTNSDGDSVGEWFDAVHPVGSARYQYYQQMAPFVAAAFDSQI